MFGVREEQLARSVYKALYGVTYILEDGQIILFPHENKAAVAALARLMINCGYTIVCLAEIKRG